MRLTRMPRAGSGSSRLPLCASTSMAPRMLCPPGAAPAARASIASPAARAETPPSVRDLMAALRPCRKSLTDTVRRSGRTPLATASGARASTVRRTASALPRGWVTARRRRDAASCSRSSSAARRSAPERWRPKASACILMLYKRRSIGRKTSTGSGDCQRDP